MKVLKIKGYTIMLQKYGEYKILAYGKNSIPQGIPLFIQKRFKGYRCESWIKLRLQLLLRVCKRNDGNARFVWLNLIRYQIVWSKKLIIFNYGCLQTWLAHFYCRTTLRYRCESDIFTWKVTWNYSFFQ